MSTPITKADGTTEPFRAEKLETSLTRAGASRDEVRRVVEQVEQELFPGMTTEAIYRRAFAILRESTNLTATKYSLRRALFGLGPTGFPFETFLARLFEDEGYEVDIGKTMHGNCAPHELDLIAYKTNDCFVAEAKFHQRPAVKSDLQVALYSYARFLDLKGHKPTPKACGVVSYWIITNTKFTKTAVEYAECVGLSLLSWGYPHKNNLQSKIEEKRLYPITVLTSLTRKEKASLLQTGVILCRDLIDNRDHLRSIGLPHNKIERVMAESSHLCKG